MSGRIIRRVLTWNTSMRRRCRDQGISFFVSIRKYNGGIEFEGAQKVIKLICLSKTYS